MFSVKGLSFSYPGSIALFTGLDLSIGKSEFVLLQGDNGTGKSTLLRLLTGVLKADEGRVLLDGKDPSEHNPQAFNNLFWLEQSSRENLFGITPRHDLELWRIAEPDALSQVILPQSELLDVPYTRLSTGQLKSAALLCLPYLLDRFWLLDEPLAGLDSAHCKEFFAMCAAKRASGWGMLMVSHSADFPAGLFDRILTLSAGKLREMA